MNNFYAIENQSEYPPVAVYSQSLILVVEIMNFNAITSDSCITPYSEIRTCPAASLPSRRLISDHNYRRFSSSLTRYIEQCHMHISYIIFCIFIWIVASEAVHAPRRWLRQKYVAEQVRCRRTGIWHMWREHQKEHDTCDLLRYHPLVRPMGRRRRTLSDCWVFFFLFSSGPRVIGRLPRSQASAYWLRIGNTRSLGKKGQELQSEAQSSSRVVGIVCLQS